MIFNTTTPSGATAEALTDAEIEEAVDDAFASIDKTVSVSLVDPISPSYFESCTLYELLSYEGYVPALGNQVGSIDSPTGSTEIVLAGNIYGLFVACEGGVMSAGTSSCTGDIVALSDQSSTYAYEVDGDGTITISDIDWND